MTDPDCRAGRDFLSLVPAQGRACRQVYRDRKPASVPACDTEAGMDFGRHAYYFACPRPACGKVYEVLEISLRADDHGGRHGHGHEHGLLTCPYCGWIVHLHAPVLALRRVLGSEQQAAVRRLASCRTGRLDVAMRLRFEHG